MISIFKSLVFPPPSAPDIAASSNNGPGWRSFATEESGLFVMDPTFENLPYQIPGPAGGPSYATTSQAVQAPSAKSEAARKFQQAAWQTVLRQVSAPPFGDTSIASSIALLRANALSNRFTRLQRLPVLLGSLSWVGRDASVTLVDPTGAICATVHAAVFAEHRTGIEPGSALLLDAVAAMAYVERRPSGFRIDESEGLHVSIQACHVKAVIPVGVEMPAPPRHFAADPKESYERAVLSPPVARRPPTRRVSPPQSRQPLHPRVEPQHANQNRRSVHDRGGNHYGGVSFEILSHSTLLYDFCY